MGVLLNVLLNDAGDFCRRERRSRRQYERQWNKLLEKLCHKGKFHTRFRMSETAFNNLVELLRPALQRVV